MTARAVESGIDSSLQHLKPLRNNLSHKTNISGESIYPEAPCVTGVEALAKDMVFYQRDVSAAITQHMGCETLWDIVWLIKTHKGSYLPKKQICSSVPRADSLLCSCV